MVQVAGFCLLVGLAGCRPTPLARPLAFYYWQTTFRLTPVEQRYLDSLHCQTLYVKFLDIGRDPDQGSIRPLSQLEVSDTSGLAGRLVVPTVFITNNVFQNNPPAGITDLAANTAVALKRISSRFPPGRVAPLYQFDCDWTPSTRTAYFDFLQKIRRVLPPGSRLSATIRLHQYKFPQQTGVPPVDRGMLMLYNTGQLDDPDELNSIFQPADARRYLAGAPARYALPLDVALPVFSWALVFRDEEFWKIIPDPDPLIWADTTRFTPVGPRHFRIRQGTFVGGHYLRPDDQLRVEAISPALLRNAAQLASRSHLANDATIAFFHLDSAIIARYPVSLMDSVWQVFQQ